jgi:hypothetical protein
VEAASTCQTATEGRNVAAEEGRTEKWKRVLPLISFKLLNFAV